MMRFLAQILFMACLACAGQVRADSPVGSLEQSAISVRHPARALLISVVDAGNRLVAVGGHGVIIYSDDNGQSWKQAAVPVSETISTVAFANPKDGWAAGAQGVVLHTTDGGANWQLQLTGRQVIKLMATAASEFASANAGSDEAERALRRSDIFTKAGPNKPFLTVLPLSSKSAFIFGAYRMAVLTTDGGKSWVDWSLHVGDPISHGIFDAIRSGSSIYLAGEAGVVLHSADAGQSFSMLTSPDPSTLFGILQTQAGTLLSFGVAGELFRSTDQGQSWSQANISANSDLTSGIILRSGAIVVTSVDGGVFESKDDGKSFQNLALNEGMALYDLVQAENGNVVFVGSGGVQIEPALSF